MEPQEADGPGNAPVIDLEQLRETCGDDEELMQELQDEFWRSAPEAFAAVARAAEAGDASELVLAAHSFKGACWSLGAVPLGAVLARLEGAGKSGDLSGVGGLMARAEVEFHRLGEALGDDRGARAA